MKAEVAELVAFHLTGERTGSDLDEVADLKLRPALFAGYGDLSRLRYDYPLVLVEGGDEVVVRSLCDVIDDVLREVAPRGAAGERLRQQVLRLEGEIRRLVASGTTGSLSRLWGKAAKSLQGEADKAAKKVLRESLQAAKAALEVDGRLIDCDGEAPRRLTRHVWAAEQRQKARSFRADVDRLCIRLNGMLKADFLKSDEALAPKQLAGSIGDSFQDVFDFKELSRILRKTTGGERLPAERRERLRRVLGVLEQQRFYPEGAGEGKSWPRDFVFDSAGKALKALRRRLPEMAEVSKALSIAELEVDNRYREERHDRYFEDFGADDLTAKDLAIFPTCLVCLRESDDNLIERASMLEILSSGLPIKVLVQSDDILGRPRPGQGQFALGANSLQLATMAVGLSSVYVLQAASSHLYAQSARLEAGMRYPGPALISVFSGMAGEPSELSPYLTAAAALQSRAFPNFVYDPAAGEDWAERFSVVDNPEAETAWTRANVHFADEDLQVQDQQVTFSFIDFVASDRRYASHFVRLPRDKWHDDMIPAGDYLATPEEAGAAAVPYVLMVDGDNRLQRVVVDERMIAAARRCGEMWYSLQELGGIHNSHARRLLEAERAAWEEEKQRELAALRQERPAAAPSPPVESEAAPAAAEAVPAAEPEPEPEAEVPGAGGDDPYIEMPRCTTCNECTELNGRMFAYDDNKRAYIADADAGTFRDLVEAAENCQVSIIHPGKPRNPDEPGLDELLARAELFN